jgi:hypothetical protein
VGRPDAAPRGCREAPSNTSRVKFFAALPCWRRYRPSGSAHDLHEQFGEFTVTFRELALPWLLRLPRSTGFQLFGCVIALLSIDWPYMPRCCRMRIAPLGQGNIWIADYGVLEARVDPPSIAHAIRLAAFATHASRRRLFRPVARIATFAFCDHRRSGGSRGSDRLRVAGGAPQWVDLPGCGPVLGGRNVIHIVDEPIRLLHRHPATEAPTSIGPSTASYFGDHAGILPIPCSACRPC